MTIQSPFVYQNSEIIDNIHFYSAVEKLRNPIGQIEQQKPTRPAIEQSEEIFDSLKEFCTKESANRYLDRSRGYSTDRSEQLKLELQELFKKQHPDQLYSLKSFEF